MRNYFKDWTLFEKSWLLIFTLLGIYLSYVWGESPIGLLAFLTGIWCVILVTKGKISNYYFGLVNVVAYGYVAYTRQLYGEVMLNWGYFIPAQIWGLWLWTRAKNRRLEDTKAVIAKALTNYQRIGVAAILIISIISYGHILQLIKGNLPWIDSAGTMLQVVAMVLMALRYREQWALWIVVNILQITMWGIVLFKQGANDISALMMWSAYLVNSFYGFYTWGQMVKDRQECLESPLARTYRKFNDKFKCD